MRFCVNGRQPYSVIKKADEIKFSYNDRDRILDLVEKYPEKTVILDVPGQEGDWKTWQMYAEKFDNFYIALHDLSRSNEFIAAGIKWYWPFPITSYYELGMIVSLRPSYLLLGPPLSFELEKVAKQAIDPLNHVDKIPLRMVVNTAHPAYLPTDGSVHGICGQWVRPEDCQLYSTRIQCFEFDNVDLKQEETLLHIYKENKEWPGNLNLLIQRLNFDVDNRAIPEELGERRMSCGHRCWSGSGCHLCVSAFKFADQIRKEHLRRNKKADVDNN